MSKKKKAILISVIALILLLAGIGFYLWKSAQDRIHSPNRLEGETESVTFPVSDEASDSQLTTAAKGEQTDNTAVQKSDDAENPTGNENSNDIPKTNSSSKASETSGAAGKSQTDSKPANQHDENELMEIPLF